MRPSFAHLAQQQFNRDTRPRMTGLPSITFGLISIRSRSDMHGKTTIDLATIELQLSADFDTARQRQALGDNIERIARAAQETLRLAGASADAIDAVYFTGGSTGLAFLVDRIGSCCPRAERIRGDRFTSVISGLAIAATRRWAK